jgi:NH3-dependent NAD+ synthetase
MGVYINIIHVLPKGFLMKLIKKLPIPKEISRAEYEYEYINIPPPPN